MKAFDEFSCRVCGNNMSGEEVVTISRTNSQEEIYFHPECFLEIAGEEYTPKVYEFNEALLYEMYSKAVITSRNEPFTVRRDKEADTKVWGKYKGQLWCAKCDKRLVRAEEYTVRVCFRCPECHSRWIQTKEDIVKILKASPEEMRTWDFFNQRYAPL
jgi:phage FluMu protein Com